MVTLPNVTNGVEWPFYLQGERVDFPVCIIGHMTSLQGRVYLQGVSTSGVFASRGCLHPGGYLHPGGFLYPGGFLHPGTGSASRGICICGEGGLHPGVLGRPPTGTRKTGGTHPTGMLSCSVNTFRTTNITSSSSADDYVTFNHLFTGNFRLSEPPEQYLSRNDHRGQWFAKYDPT